MIASLPMYARPELDEVHTHLWASIRTNLERTGIKAPETLSQDADLMATWMDPALVLSQACGMPYRKFLHGKVKLVGTPVYDLENCPPGHYRSAIVVRRNDPGSTLTDFAQARFAYNEDNSQSGMAAPLIHAATQGVRFSNRIQSHSHVVSASMVSDNLADIASLDAVSWKLMDRHDGFSKRLRLLEWTSPTTPVLPFITSVNQNVDQIFAAIERAIEELSPEERDTICLKGIVKIPAEEYLKVPNPQM